MTGARHWATVTCSECGKDFDSPAAVWLSYVLCPSCADAEDAS